MAKATQTTKTKKTNTKVTFKNPFSKSTSKSKTKICPTCHQEIKN